MRGERLSVLLGGFESRLRVVSVRLADSEFDALLHAFKAHAPEGQPFSAFVRLRLCGGQKPARPAKSIPKKSKGAK